MDEYSNETNQSTPIYNDENKHRKIRKDIFPGLFVLIVGVIFLLKQLGVIFPYWFFTWPVLLIAIGLFISFKHGFRGAAGVFPILVGSVFLIDEVTPGLELKNFIWPIIIIAVGLLLILRPKGNNRWRKWQQDWEKQHHWENFAELPASSDVGDYIDSTAIFSGIKKIILSKNFKGGDITNFMGGTEINLSQADMNGTITIDATNIFGGTKLIVPPTWNVQSEVISIFGGVEDKRLLNGTNLDPNKVIRLHGTCLFGGIEIKSF